MWVGHFGYNWNMDHQKQIKKLDEWLHASRRIVFFGGAGVSTESGIPDFRSAGGLYQSPGETSSIPPEIRLSARHFTAQPADFFAYYFQHLLHPSALPNPAHLALAAWEARGRVLAVITQNIDGLHQTAGSRHVLELHGSVHRNHCLRCQRVFPRAQMDSIRDHLGIPRCACGGIVRPDVVLYGEGLDDRVWNQAMAAIRAADLLIVGGTSLTVYPAAGLVDGYHGSRLVIINQDPTPYDSRADLRIPAPIGRVFSQLSAPQGRG